MALGNPSSLVGAFLSTPNEFEYFEWIFSESIQSSGDSKLAKSSGAIRLLLHNISNMLGETEALKSSVASRGMIVIMRLAVIWIVSSWVYIAKSMTAVILDFNTSMQQFGQNILPVFDTLVVFKNVHLFALLRHQV